MFDIYGISLERKKKNTWGYKNQNESLDRKQVYIQSNQILHERSYSIQINDKRIVIIKSLNNSKISIEYL